MGPPSQTFGPSQATEFPFSNQYPATPSNTQLMDFRVAPEAPGDLAHLELQQNYNLPLNNNYDVNFNLQQMQWRTHAARLDPYLDPNSSVWGLPDLPNEGSLYFNTSRTGQYGVQMTRQASIASSAPDLPNGGSFNFNTSRNGHNGVPMTRQTSIASSAASTLSLSMRDATDSPSPALLDHFDGMRGCQWQLAGNNICGLMFDNVRDLNNHVLVEHVKTEQPSETHGYVCRWLGCSRQTSDHCEGKRGFEGRSKLKRHIRVHTGSGTYSLYHLALRIDLQLDMDTDRYSLVESFVCDVCFKPFNNAQALRTHQVTHSDARPFVCDVKTCMKSFKTQDSLSEFSQMTSLL